MPVKTVGELIAYAKSNPRALNYGSGGVGSTNHLAGEMFVKATGIRMEHVAYKGSSEYMRDLTPGVIQLVFAGADQATSAAKLGTARAIATTGTKRLSELPDVPTMEESGIPLQIYSWTGILAPAQTPVAIIDKLAREMQKAVRDPELKKHLPVHDLIGSTPQEFAKFLEAERVQVAEIVKSINLSSVSKSSQN